MQVNQSFLRKQQHGKCHAIRGHSDFARCCPKRQECRGLSCAHFTQVARARPANEETNPVQIRFHACIFHGARSRVGCRVSDFSFDRPRHSWRCHGRVSAGFRAKNCFLACRANRPGSDRPTEKRRPATDYRACRPELGSRTIWISSESTQMTVNTPQNEADS